MPLLGSCSTRLEEEEAGYACQRAAAAADLTALAPQALGVPACYTKWSVILVAHRLVSRCSPCRFHCWLVGWLAGRSTPKALSALLSQGLTLRGGVSRTRSAGWLAGRKAGGPDGGLRGAYKPVSVPKNLTWTKCLAERRAIVGN